MHKLYLLLLPVSYLFLPTFHSTYSSVCDWEHWFFCCGEYTALLPCHSLPPARADTAIYLQCCSFSCNFTAFYFLCCSYKDYVYTPLRTSAYLCLVSGAVSFIASAVCTTVQPAPFLLNRGLPPPAAPHYVYLSNPVLSVYYRVFMPISATLYILGLHTCSLPLWRILPCTVRYTLNHALLHTTRVEYSLLLLFCIPEGMHPTFILDFLLPATTLQWLGLYMHACLSTTILVHTYSPARTLVRWTFCWFARCHPIISRAFFSTYSRCDMPALSHCGAGSLLPLLHSYTPTQWPSTG